MDIGDLERTVIKAVDGYKERNDVPIAVLVGVLESVKMQYYNATVSCGGDEPRDLSLVERNLG